MYLVNLFFPSKSIRYNEDAAQEFGGGAIVRGLTLWANRFVDLNSLPEVLRYVIFSTLAAFK